MKKIFLHRVRSKNASTSKDVKKDLMICKFLSWYCYRKVSSIRKNIADYFHCIRSNNKLYLLTHYLMNPSEEEHFNIFS